MLLHQDTSALANVELALPENSTSPVPNPVPIPNPNANPNLADSQRRIG